MNVCKFCGAGHHGEDTLGYECASWRYRGSDVWIQSAVCQQRSLKLRLRHEDTIETLRQRIERAVEAAQQASRLSLGLQDEGGEEVDWEHDNVVYVLESDLDRVVEILTGNSPENQEGSP